MEKEINRRNGLSHIIKSTLLSLLILLIPCIMLAMAKVSFLGALLPLVIIFLFFYAVASLLFSSILYYLKKNVSMILYLIFFLYCLWTLIFFLSNYSKSKYANKLYDDMDGVSESMTTVLIIIVYISFFSNFVVFFRSWYIDRRNSISADDLEI